MNLSIHITGIKESEAKLEKLRIGLKEGMDPALIEIGVLGSKYFGGVAFQSKGSAFGKPWAPLADSTIAEKDKLGYRGVPDMVRTTNMLNSFGFVMEGNGAVRLSNSAEYFAYHQSADTRHKLPRRVMIGINDSFLAIVKTAVKTQVKIITAGALA